MNCAGSIKLSALVPRSPTSVHAAEGTVAHSLAEQYLTGKLDYMELQAKVGEIVEEQGHEITLTQEMVDGAELYRETITTDRREMEARKGALTAQSFAEKKVAAVSIDNRVWGTADYITYQSGHRLIVYDYKFGKGVVKEAESNEQLILYIIGVIDTLLGGNMAFDKIEGVIVQPRAPHVEGPVRRWTVTREEIIAFRKRAAKAAVETLNPAATLTAGTWCRWCPAVAVCPEMHKSAMEAAKADFALAAPAIEGKTKKDRENAAMVARLPDARLMSDAQLVRALEWEDVINGFYEAVKETLRERLSSGGTVPGAKLVEGRSNRVWGDEELVKKELSYLGKALFTEPELKSVAEVEKVLGKGKVPERLITKPQGKVSVALDRDPRPVARSSAQEDFTEIPAATDATKPDNDLLAQLDGAPMPKRIWA